MAVTPAILLAKLHGLSIDTELLDHPAVMTVEEANKYTGDDPGVDVKNLFLKDKKGRLFLVTAEANTKVDLKALGLRLGLPKPGVRMAPPELLMSILGVPPGSVTPLAVVQETASAVMLLLDHKLKGQNRILVHPLTNTSTVAISSEGLEKFLASVQRQAHYVDLEAQPETGPDQADLRHLLPTEAPADPVESTSSTSEQSAAPQPAAAFNPAANAPPQAAPSKEVKQKAGKKGAKDAAVSSKAIPPAPSIQDTATRLLQQILQRAGLDTSLSAEAVQELDATLFMEMNALQNKCFSDGYMAGKHEVSSYCLKTFGS